MNETRLIVSQRLDLILSAPKDKPLVLSLFSTERAAAEAELVWRKSGEELWATFHKHQHVASCKNVRQTHFQSFYLLPPELRLLTGLLAVGTIAVILKHTHTPTTTLSQNRDKAVRV